MPASIEKFLNAIFCSDAFSFTKRVPSSSIDMIITSPPYNFKKSYDGDDSNDDLHIDVYLHTFLLPIWKECYRILKDDGRIAINIQPLYKEYVLTHHLISEQLSALGFKLMAEFVWDKGNFSEATSTAFGSWLSPSAPFIRYRHEFILVFAKKTRKKPMNPEYIKYYGSKKEAKNALIDLERDKFLEWTISPWNFSGQGNMVKKFGHPAMFPEELPERLVKLYTYKGDVVFDPFLGAGTTAVASWNNDRRFIGCDHSLEYCKTAFERIKKFAFQKKLFSKPYPFKMPKPRIIDLKNKKMNC